jgi:hypothetical protein
VPACSSRRFFLSAAVLGFALVAPSSVSAHVPTEGVPHYGDGATDTYKYETAVPLWLRGPFYDGAVDEWPVGMNSTAPNWSLNTNSANLVRYLELRSETLDRNECDPDVVWLACAWYDGVGRWGAIEYVNDTQFAGTWCQDTTNTVELFHDGCYNVSRVALHELGHIAGLARMTDGNAHQSSTASETNTVMKGSTPSQPNAGWDSASLKRCDLIELQRRYGVDSYAGSYADCVDHLGAGTSNGKISTVVTISVSTTLQCVGSAVTFSGSAKLSSDANLADIKGNPLQGRTVSLRRGGSSVASDTVSSSGAWSLAHTSPAGTYSFDARYAGELSLDADNSATRTVTWSSSC